MKPTVFILLFLALAASPAFGQKVFIDYDKNFEPGTLKTFQWKKTADTSLEEHNPLLHSRIVEGIEHYLAMGGMIEVEEDPDAYVTYHGSTETDVAVTTSTYGYVIPMGWGYGGYGGFRGVSTFAVGVGATSNTSVYKKGTLIVDVWNARTKELVWRGIASELKMTEVAETMAKRVDKALGLMVKKWGKIKKERAKEKN
jgi:hypothetical protein